MKNQFLFLILVLSINSFAVAINPDSIVFNDFKPLVRMHSAIDTVVLTNQSILPVTIDSIFIRFLDGDSADFTMGHDCHPGNFLEYNYGGWVYGGETSMTLRYIRDSLFLLQDSSGLPVTISINPLGFTQFGLQVISNCPVCGRMPSFPKTTKYRYLFHVFPDSSCYMSVSFTAAAAAKSLPVKALPVKRNSTSRYNLLGRTAEKNPVTNSILVVPGDKNEAHLH